MAPNEPSASTSWMLPGASGSATTVTRTRSESSAASVSRAATFTFCGNPRTASTGPPVKITRGLVTSDRSMPCSTTHGASARASGGLVVVRVIDATCPTLAARITSSAPMAPDGTQMRAPEVCAAESSEARKSESREAPALRATRSTPRLRTWGAMVRSAAWEAASRTASRLSQSSVSRSMWTGTPAAARWSRVGPGIGSTTAAISTPGASPARTARATSAPIAPRPAIASRSGGAAEWLSVRSAAGGGGSGR